MKFKIVPFILVCIGLIVGCGTHETTQENESLTEPVNLETLTEAIDVHTTSAIMDHADVVLIDVREQWEYDEKHIPGITLVPMSELESRLAEIPTDKTVILTCRSGNRSGQVHAFLTAQGYDNTHNMEGGILAWEAAGLPVEQ